MNDYRGSLVLKAFAKLDRNGSGSVDIEDIRGVYNASKHPAVVDGRKTSDQVLGEFLETFESHHNIMNGGSNDNVVTLDEFIDYYCNVSSSIDDDLSCLFFVISDIVCIISSSVERRTIFPISWSRPVIKAESEIFP